MHPTAWDGIEQRTHQRFGVPGSSVQYRSAGLLSFLEGLSPKYLILNVSRGGLYFITRDELPVGRRLNLVMEAPRAAVPITTSAVVVWTRKSSDHAAWRTGVKLLKMSDRSEKLLRHVLDNTVLRKVDISTSIYLKEIERI
jgi:hypothetical protein